MKSKLIIVILILLAGIGYFISRNSQEQPNMPKGISINKSKYPITGIDLSNHSGEVDFAALKKENLDFVFLKVSEGETFKDKRFERNYANAIQEGFIVGFYHFYRFDRNPVKQADFFAREIKSREHRLPLVIDVEEWGNKIVKSKDKIIEDIHTFIKRLEKLTELEVMIYTNESGYNTYIKKRFPDYKIWICSFKSPPPTPWLFWQHSHKGKFDSVEGWTDINTFNGTRSDWEQFIQN